MDNNLGNPRALFFVTTTSQEQEPSGQTPAVWGTELHALTRC